MADWARPHYRPLPSSRPALFYLVFGEAPASDALNISRVRHHVDAIQPELQVSRHPRHADPAWFDGWLSSAIGSEIPHVFGVECAPAVYDAKHVTAVRGEFDDPDSLAYLRNTIGVVSAVAEASNAVAILDAHALAWWRPADWRRRFVEASGFYIEEQVSIAVTEDPRFRPGIWTHTRGMRKFGRPELQVKHLPGAYDVSNPAIRDSGILINGLANHLAGGAVIEDGQTMRLQTYDSTIVFFESPDDSETAKHFNNAVLEVCDIDPDTGISGEGIPLLLERMGAHASG
jgi:hypothetical protein